MRESDHTRGRYVAVLAASILVGSLAVSQPWADSAPGLAETGDAGLDPSAPELDAVPFMELGEAEPVLVEHLPFDVQDIAPAAAQVQLTGVRLCAASIGPYSMGRTYCGDSNTRLSYTIGMTDDEIRAVDPTFEIIRGPAPEHAVLVALDDGSEAVFTADPFPQGSEIVRPSVVGEGDTVAHLLTLTWLTPDGNPVALRAVANGEPADLTIDDLVALANSLTGGQQVVAVPTPSPEALIDLIRADPVGVAAELTRLGLDVSVEESSEYGLDVAIRHELVSFGNQYWLIPGSSLEIVIGGN